MSTDFTAILLRDLSKLLEKGVDYNVLIQVGEEPNVKSFKAHSGILRARCPYFQAALSETWVKHEDGIILFSKPNISAETFEIILREPELLFKSDDYSSVNLNVLLRVLQRDDLQLDEVEIWNYLVQWGIYQTSETVSSSSKDLTKLPISEWSTEHLVILRSTIQQCVPLIRMFQISSRDFYSKVMPYQSILPPALYEDIMRYHMVPDCPRPTSLMPARRGGIESNLLRAKHVALISSWMDRNDLNVFCNATSIPYEFSNVPYEFKLLLRGSRDGFSPQAFHSRCDFQGATLLVLKVHGIGHLIGGYNPLNWDSTNKWGNTKDSFLFSLGDGEDIRNSILSRIQENNRAVLCSQAIGACFGSGDLVMGGTHSNFNVELGCSCKRQSYERPLMNTNHDRFSVDEYEVFKIVPRIGANVAMTRPNLTSSAPIISKSSSSSTNSSNSSGSSRGSGRFSLLLSQLHSQQ
ncbi:5073_t:CDS:2 [Acaulospora colombiana]|uniref:5073_t:CDS:1 n=1 Tax=Acaulospora colombiana TaxID=27376 RepID=A0ACA9M2C7_9GLOM|nr:5073_t:CDS:2 [Acaulospora colombiana]